MSQLRLYNTLSRKKEDFVPLDAKNVRMYVCGPTVYDYAHIGNARPVIVFDVLFRLLRHLYGESHVTYVRNITDVDDKINARAAEEKIPIRELTEKTAKQYEDDVTALGNLKPTHEPRATDHIKQMIALIEKLIAAKHAYVAEGHVLYDVSSKPDYGKLSRRSLDEMIAGARVEVAPYKKNPMDFVLWKPSTPELPGWESPWGRGRPGWHIECSAMSEAYLGETFDIHGGGIDLLFPHHENEIAQSEGAHHNHPFARVWMHNGFLQVEGDKMSKSLGNFVTIRELLRGWQGRMWTGAAIRWAMMQSYYRDPIDWTFDGLLSATAEVGSLASACDIISFKNRRNYDELWRLPLEPSNSLIEALVDDLNFPEALKIIRERLKSLTNDDDDEHSILIHDLRFLGLFEPNRLRCYRPSIGLRGSGIPVDLLSRASSLLWRVKVYRANGELNLEKQVIDELKNIDVRIVDDKYGIYTGEYTGTETRENSIESLIDARNAARKAKNFKESDRIRDELDAKGIMLKDNPDGTTTWEVKR